LPHFFRQPRAQKALAVAQGDVMQIKNLKFRKSLPESKIQKRIELIAEEINRDYTGKTPVFLPVLNGSFMFAADLIKRITIDCRISFTKVSSYSGTASSGQIKSLIGHDESVFNQDILIVEDIVDTGLTLQRILDELKDLGARSVETVTLLRKKPARDKNIPVKYVGFELEEEFVVGYGLDYDGLGRNLKDLYVKD
jgi:hypoxanthine phosphoribosyltransferase